MIKLYDYIKSKLEIVHNGFKAVVHNGFKAVGIVNYIITV